MPFQYSKIPHERKHGPDGYIDYTTYKDWLRDEFTFQCVYCLEREQWYPNRCASFGVDHVKPKGNAAYAHLVCNYVNLVYACNRCNWKKQNELLLDPCVAGFGDHLAVGEEGTIAGITLEGEDLVQILGLDMSAPTSERRNRLRLRKMYQQDPANEDLRAMFLAEFGYPDDLPNLGSLRPKSNSKPNGVSQSYFRQREAGILPEAYGI
jgi:hypothetical protein